jgi:hypothetical protein
MHLYATGRAASGSNGTTPWWITWFRRCEQNRSRPDMCTVSVAPAAACVTIEMMEPQQLLSLLLQQHLQGHNCIATPVAPATAAAAAAASAAAGPSSVALRLRCCLLLSCHGVTPKHWFILSMPATCRRCTQVGTQHVPWLVPRLQSQGWQHTGLR